MDDASHAATDPDWRTIDKPPKISQSDWDAFKAALTARTNLTDTGKFAFLTTFAWEGGMKVNASNGATAGITQTMLADAKSKGDIADLAGVGQPRDLTPPQVVELYQFVTRQNFHTVGGVAALDRVGNPYAAAALADTSFTVGATGGATVVQRTINDIDRPNSIAVDGQMGPATFAAYARLAQNPATLATLLDTLAYERQALYDEYGWPSDPGRLAYFRFAKMR